MQLAGVLQAVGGPVELGLLCLCLGCFDARPPRRSKRAREWGVRVLRRREMMRRLNHWRHWSSLPNDVPGPPFRCLAIACLKAGYREIDSTLRSYGGRVLFHTNARRVSFAWLSESDPFQSPLILSLLHLPRPTQQSATGTPESQVTQPWYLQPVMSRLHQKDLPS